MIERRKYVRILESGPVGITREGKPQGYGELLDLSVRGIRMTTLLALKRGEKVRMSFRLGEGIEMKLAAVIRHSYRWKAESKIYGLEFFIRDFSDLREHVKLNRFILEERGRQDKLLRDRFHKEKK